MDKYAARSAVFMPLAIVLFAASACSSAPPPLQPWFIEHFAIGQAALPQGVSAQVIQNKASYFPREYLFITNVSPTFLYLSAIEPPYSAPTGPQFEPPPIPPHAHGIPVFRVAMGQAEVWGLATHDPPWEHGWMSVQKYGLADGFRLHLTGFHLIVESSAYYGYVLLRIETPNRFDYGDGRPANVQMPDPQTAVLPLMYGDEEIDLPLTISYTLNED